MTTVEQKIIWHKDLPEAITFEDQQLIIILDNDYDVYLWRWDNHMKEFRDSTGGSYGYSSLPEIRDDFGGIKAWAFFEYPAFKKEGK